MKYETCSFRDHRFLSKMLINLYINPYQTLFVNAQEIETYEFLDIKFDSTSKTQILTDNFN